MFEKSWRDLRSGHAVFGIRVASPVGIVLVTLRVQLLQSVCLCEWDVDGAAVVLMEYGEETCRYYVSLSGAVVGMDGCDNCSSA